MGSFVERGGWAWSGRNLMYRSIAHWNSVIGGSKELYSIAQSRISQANSGEGLRYSFPGSCAGVGSAEGTIRGFEH